MATRSAASDVEQAPVTLKVIGEVAAGHPFAGQIGPGEAARIFTGGVLPQGADTVVIQEHTASAGDSVTIQKSTAKGRNVRGQGIDFERGQMLLRKGRQLADRDLMLAAAMNHPTLSVHRRPKVAVLGTGDELVPPGSNPDPGQIVYSNGFALSALARAKALMCMTLASLAIASRTSRPLCAVRANAAPTSLSPPAAPRWVSMIWCSARLAGEGLDLSFWRVALRPGRPMMHGRLNGMQVLGLPGNPVSSYVCAFLFLVPLIRRLAGRQDTEHVLESARLGLRPARQ